MNHLVLLLEIEKSREKIERERKLIPDNRERGEKKIDDEITLFINCI